MPARNPMFAICCAAQRSSTELIIYSRDAGQCVEIAYPICRGSRILPSGIAAYLMRRCCFWECFCGLVNDRPTPVRFVTSATGHTRAICHFQVSRCRFSINLNETRHTALLESSYDYFPTQVHGDIPNITLLLTNFRVAISNLPFGHAEIAPYFVDYLGSHSSMHQLASARGITQSILSPFFVRRQVDGNRHHSSSTIWKPKDILLGHAQRGAADCTDAPQLLRKLAMSRVEQGHMHTLAAGMGISRYDAIGLTEECDGCGKWFMASALRAHILEGCSKT